MSLRRSLFSFAQGIAKKTGKVELFPGVATYNQDGVLTSHNSDFQTEPRFKSAYAAGVATGSWGREKVQWRAHVVAWAAKNALHLEGDFVECGVNKGGMASVIFKYTGLDQSSRRLWLLDTYNGLVDQHLTDAEKRRGGKNWAYEECFESVKALFAPYPNVVLVRGAIPDTLPQVTSDRVAYLGIDLNCTEPEIAAASFFWDRMSSGAVMVLDDYGWTGHEEQKLAFDEFARKRGVEILSLPTGQGLVLKP